MLRDEIKKDIAGAVKGLGLELEELEIEVARTADAKFGDFTTNVALKVSHDTKQSPMEFAKILTDSLKNQPYLKKLRVI